MTTREAQSAIESLGWETEEDLGFKTALDDKRAVCGCFYTPWRDDWQTVLADVKAMKEKQAQPQ